MEAGNLSGGAALNGAAARKAFNQTLLTTRKDAGERICPYYLDPVSDSRWAAFVERNPKASVFHSTKWLQALRDVYGYEPVVVTSCPGESSLTNGIVFCRIKSWMTGKRLVSLPFSDHCEPLFEHAEELESILMTLEVEVDGGKWKYIEIRPLAYEPDSHTGLTRLSTYWFHSLDLRAPVEHLFGNFHKNCVQRKIRRAEKEKLRYQEGTSDDLIEKFYRLLVMTRRRQFLPPQPLSWFRGLVSAFGADLKIRLASHKGIPVAGILTLLHKKSMVYKYGCSDVAFNNLGGTALLFWQAIQEAKERGLEEFEWGRSDIENAGLIAFKEHWGATRKAINYWAYPASYAPELSVWKKKIAHRLVPLAPDLALKTAGHLLYRHIG